MHSFKPIFKKDAVGRAFIRKGRNNIGSFEPSAAHFSDN